MSGKPPFVNSGLTSQKSEGFGMLDNKYSQMSIAKRAKEKYGLQARINEQRKKSHNNTTKDHNSAISNSNHKRTLVSEFNGSNRMFEEEYGSGNIHINNILIPPSQSYPAFNTDGQNINDENDLRDVGPLESTTKIHESISVNHKSPSRVKSKN